MKFDHYQPTSIQYPLDDCSQAFVPSTLYYLQRQIMKASSKQRVERLTPEEERDVKQSLREIKEGKARTVNSVDQLFEELKAE